jgi:hypothetical protein
MKLKYQIQIRSNYNFFGREKKAHWRLTVSSPSTYIVPGDKEHEDAFNATVKMQF